MNFLIPVDRVVKIKETKDKQILETFDITDKMEHECDGNYKVCAQGTVFNILAKRLETCCQSYSNERKPTQTCVRNSHEVNNNNNNNNNNNYYYYYYYDNEYETRNNIIIECRKLTKKEYQSRHDWVCKVSHPELGKKFKFDHSICTTQDLSWRMRPTNSSGKKELAELWTLLCWLSTE